jgi:hypothetical protein
MVGSLGLPNGAVQGIVGQISSALGKGSLNITQATAMLSQMMASNNSVRQGADAAARLKFAHVLEEALEKAHRPGGNIQTQINDLMVKLRNLARESTAAQAMTPQELQALVNKQQQMNQILAGIMKKQSEIANGVIQNLR